MKNMFIRLEVKDKHHTLVRIDAIDAITANENHGQTYVFVRGGEQPFITTSSIEDIMSTCRFYDDVPGGVRH